MPHQSNDCTICDLITNTSNIKMNDKLVVSKSIHSESCRTIDSTSIGSSHSLSTSYSDLTSTASSSCTCSTTGSPTTSPTASPNPARPISFGSSPRTIPPTNSLSARCEPNPMPFRFNGYCNPAFVCSTDISEDRDSAKLVERSLTDRHLRVPMDSGYQCWIIAFSCCFINAILFGIYRSYALIYPELINLYQVSRGDATWPFSLCMTMVHMAGPLSSGLKRWFSTRCIYLIGCTMSCAALVACRFAPDIPSLILQIGLIQGIGIGLTYVQNVAILNEYFDQKRGLANGISMAGGTLGAFVMSPLLEWSLDQFGLFDSYLLLAAIGAFTVPAALILRSNKRKLIPLSPAKRPNLSSVFSKHHPSAIFTQPSLKSSSVPPALGHVNSTCTTSMEQLQVPLPSNTFAKPKTYDFYRAPVERPKTTIASKLKKVFSHVDFYLVMGSHLAYFWGVITFNMVVVDLLQDNHLPLNSASHMITAFAFGDLVGRAGTGWIVDKPFCSRSWYMAVCTALTALFLKSVTFGQSYQSLMIISLALGFLSGAIVILINICLSEKVGAKLTPIAFGLSSFVCGVTTLIRPASIAFFRDRGGSYNGLFDLLSLFAAFFALAWLLRICINRCKQAK